jgi:hypothetical protein
MGIDAALAVITLGQYEAACQITAAAKPQGLARTSSAVPPLGRAGMGREVEGRLLEWAAEFDGLAAAAEACERERSEGWER